MIVSIDPSLALAGFFERSGFIIVAGILRNFLLAFAMFGIFHWLIAKPLIRLNASIAGVDPQNPEGHRIAADSNHTEDEFGMLVDNINDFIAATDEHLAERTRAETGLNRHFPDDLQVCRDHTPVPPSRVKSFLRSQPMA